MKYINTIHLWNLDGFVYLNKNFLNKYETVAKNYGITKLSKELNVSYDTVAFYRRHKLTSIDFLKRICNKLKLNKSYIENSVIKYSDNLKTKYNVKFPIFVTPSILRIASMIIGDGTGSMNTVYKWSQHKQNSQWGIKFISQTLNLKPHVKKDSFSNCELVTIPHFLMKGLVRSLKIKDIKTFSFFKAIIRLSRIYKFQVFAQLVVDEGSPDQSFFVVQKQGDILKGILHLLDGLKYRYSISKDHIYLNTENFPLIKNDYNKSKSILGRYGGFWFKDARFEKACEKVNPMFSRNIRIYNDKFEMALKNLKKKKIFTYRNLKDLTKIPESALWVRIYRYHKIW